MNTGKAVLPLLVIAVGWAGCAADASRLTADPDPPTAETATPPAVNPPSSTPRFGAGSWSLAQATAAVRVEIVRLNPALNPAARCPLKELTTTEVWDRLHVQVFQVTRGLFIGQAYLIHEQAVIPLGDSFGGSGLMSLCVADLDADGRPELVFTYSWGSGSHRSLAGVWTGGATWTDAPLALRDFDLFLEKLDDRHVGLAFGAYGGSDRFVRRGEFGTLRLTPGPAGSRLEIILSDQLPGEITRRVWKQP